jgi:tetratricopeptide (TPR) repeat protein
MYRFAILAILLTFLGCSPSYYHQGRESSAKGDYGRASTLFYEEIKANPDSYSAWRELGINFYRAEDYERAEEALDQANRIQPDARATLFLGLLYEKSENYEKALAAYQTAISLNPRGKTKRMIRAHFNAVVQAKVSKEIAVALREENTLEVGSIPENTIAVVDFDKLGLPANIAPLSRGLAEFTALDLGKIQSLQVVERMKIQTLMQELQLSESNLVEPATRLRVGKLVGSQNLVTGSLQMIGESEIEVHGVVGNAVAGTTEFTNPASGDLEDFFKVQKKLVFEIVNSMNIKLTPEERAAIEEVPTESYLALMAYCRGLEFQDKGDFGQAEVSFKEAASEDSDFSEAQTQAQVAGDVADMSGDSGQGTYESFVDAVSMASVDPSGEQDYLSVIINNSGFVPSDEPGGSSESETANIPDSGIVGPVDVTVVGEINGSH